MGVEKEDGQSEHCICQLKSTDKQSISIKQHDLRVLEYNASVAHKLPVFAVQFLNTDEVWVMVRPEDLGALQRLVRGEDINKTKVKVEDEFCLDTESEEEYNVYVPGRNAGKSFLARQRYNEQKQKEADERKEKMKQKDRERRRQFAKKAKTKGNRTL